VTQQRPIGQGVNGGQFVTLRARDGTEVRGVYKPVGNEEPHLRAGVDVGTYHLREEAVSKIDRMMGGEAVVPPAFSMRVPSIVEGGTTQVGSFHKFIEADRIRGRADIDAVGLSADGERMWLIDLITANTDRHTGNFLINRTEKGVRAVAIDNGLAFGTGLDDMEWGAGQYEDGPASILNSTLHGLVNKLDLKEVADTLKKASVTPAGIESTLVRIRAMQLNPKILTESVKGTKRARMQDFFKVSIEEAGARESQLIPAGELRKIQALVPQRQQLPDLLGPEEGGLPPIGR
jgi:hypothetical protein